MKIKEKFYLMILAAYPVLYFLLSVYSNDVNALGLFVYTFIVFVISIYFGRKIFDKYYPTDIYSINNNIKSLRNGVGTLIAFIIIMLSYVFFQWYKNNELDNNSKVIIGVIIDEHKVEYCVKGKPYLLKNSLGGYHLGDSVDVVYSVNNPSISALKEKK